MLVIWTSSRVPNSVHSAAREAGDPNGGLRTKRVRPLGRPASSLRGGQVRWGRTGKGGGGGGGGGETPIQRA